mgnify:CR=1 FL=1
MGLRHPKYADVPEIQAARKQLAVQSREAMMVEWLPKHHVHENLNPDTGLGDDVGNSNPMYGLLHTHACLAVQVHSPSAFQASVDAPDMTVPDCACDFWVFTLGTTGVHAWCSLSFGNMGSSKHVCGRCS